MLPAALSKMAAIEDCSSDSILIGPGDTKDSIRTKVWEFLGTHGIALDTKAPRKMITNFVGSDDATSRMCDLQVFKESKVVRIDPDKTLQEIRFRTLESGKTLLVPTPRLMNHVVSKIVPPEDIPPEQLRSCAARQGIEQYGKAIDIDEKVSVDVYIVGSVAVSPTGVRIGKGGGMSDLAYAMLATLGSVDQKVPVITMVHDCQVLDLPDSMFCSHDVPIDIIVTPTRIIECTGNLQKPSGILWELIDDYKLKEIAVLKRIRRREQKSGYDVRLSCESEDLKLTDIVVDEEGSTVKARRARTQPKLFAEDRLRRISVKTGSAKTSCKVCHKDRKTPPPSPPPPPSGSPKCKHDKTVGVSKVDLFRCYLCGWRVLAPVGLHTDCGGDWTCSFCPDTGIGSQTDLSCHIDVVHFCRSCHWCFKSLLLCSFSIIDLLFQKLHLLSVVLTVIC